MAAKSGRRASPGWLEHFQRVLPPYAKYAIFFACGLEVFYHAIAMAINQKFFEMATKIFPVAFEMFNDTMRRGAKNEDGSSYVWSDVEMQQLQLYQTKLIVMWFLSTLMILYAMLCVVPQFCEFEESTGEQRTFCMKKPVLGWIMAPLLVLLVLVCSGVLVWQWLTCQADSDLFHRLFSNSLKEEKYLSVIERELNCITDDDKEALDTDWLDVAVGESPTGNPIATEPVSRTCRKLVEAAILNQRWLNPLFYAFLFYHLLIVLFFGFLNREDLQLPFISSGKEEGSECDPESSTRLL